MNRDQMNKIRRMAGVAQDFTPEPVDTTRSDVKKIFEKLSTEEATSLIAELLEGVVQSSSLNNDAVAYPALDPIRKVLDKQYNQYGYKHEEEEDYEDRVEPSIEQDRAPDYDTRPGDDEYDDDRAYDHPEDADGWEEDDWKLHHRDRTTMEAVSQELMPIVDAVTKAINYLAREEDILRGSDDEDDNDLRDSYLMDMKDYKMLLRIVKKGQQDAARKYWRDLDTAARDYLFDPKVLKDKEQRKLVADWFDTKLLHEAKKAKKDYDGDGKLETSEEEWKGSRDKAIKKSKGKKKMSEGKKADKDYDGDGEVESSEEEWKGSRDKAIKKAKGKKVKESMHYHTDDNYSSHAEDEVDPINVVADYETVFDQNQDMNDDDAQDYQLTNDQTPVKVPPKILSAIKDAIGEVSAEAEKAKPRDFERSNYYADTAEAFQIVHDFLAQKTVQGLKQAQVYSQRMMNVQRALMPDVVWKFIVDGGVKRSLKSYMNSLDGSFPVAGEPAPSNDPAQLNKNTNTEI